MNFGSWDKSIHNDVEQQKRIISAKKADTTPASIDKENKAAEFKGSGKVPYITTLESCTCRDFTVRKLPCKHIYRLFFELEGAQVEQGINKNEYTELSCDIFALPVESQEILYNMCVAKIYHNENIFLFERNEFNTLLLHKGFCIENVLSLDDICNLSVRDIKRIIYFSAPDMDGLPKKTAQRKSVVEWLQSNYDVISDKAVQYFICLEFTEYADKLKTTIHRRLAKIYGSTTPKDDDLVFEIRIDYGKDGKPPQSSFKKL